jgi:hypothetical protein
MAETIYIQDVFSKGELAPSMYGRISTSAYYKSLKVAKNILPTPQGNARKRFSLKRNVTLGQTDYTIIYPLIFDYLNECIYVVIFYDDSIDIYLEGRLAATVGTTGIDSADIPLIDHTVLQNTVRICTGYVNPKQLSRSASASNTITGVDTSDDFITLTNTITDDIVLPVRFTTTGALPASTPQIKTGRTYFLHALSTTTASLHVSAKDAGNDENRIDLTGSGSGTNAAVVQNTWTFANISFRNKPVYDFDGGYDALTFTPSVTTGTGTLTASGAIFTSAMVNGLYFGNGGVARITGYTSNVLVNITVIEDFASTAAIQGILSLLSEPAWSDDRGWPRVCSSYQNRGVFANNESLPNGLWHSAINDYDDFDDSSLDDDQAISWYPSSDVGNYIKYITPYKSLIVHTDTGIYSTPNQSEVAITPGNFSLTRQDDTPSTDIQPVTIDNQVFVVNGVDVNTLLWNFGQYSYSSTLVSAISEHLITAPLSMASYLDRGTRGGRYVFITNSDTGRLAMYQTLAAEEVAGWTWAATEQSYGDSYFRYALTSYDNRVWFIVEREIASPQTPIAISGFDADAKTLTCTASNFSTTEPTAFIFQNTGTLPTTSPQVAVETFYYAVGVDANDFRLYTSIANAQTDIDNSDDDLAIDVSDAGTSAFIIQYTLSTVLTLEEIDSTVATDSAITATVSTGVASGLDVLNGQTVSVKAGGVTYDTNPVIAGSMDVTLLGVLQTDLTEVEVGLPVNYQLTPLPLSIPTGQGIQTSNLAQAKHIRFVNCMFTDTIGGKINNQNIALKKLISNPFNPPEAQTGLMQVSNLSGWDDFMEPPFTITQSDPYNFILTGLFYKLEV